MLILPRQARDKHRENSEKSGVSAGFEYARDVCRLGLRAPEAARLQKLVREYKSDFRSLTDCATPENPQVVRVLSGSSLRRSRSFDNVQPITPSNERYLFAFTRQSKSASDVACPSVSSEAAPTYMVETAVAVDFNDWSKSEGGATEFGEQFIREFEERLASPWRQRHAWDSRASDASTGQQQAQQEQQLVQVMRHKCSQSTGQHAASSGVVWDVHFAVCSSISRRDAQEKLFSIGGIFDRFHQLSSVKVGQVLELRDSYLDGGSGSGGGGGGYEGHDNSREMSRRSDVFAKRCKRKQHTLDARSLEHFTMSVCADVTERERDKARERLHQQLRDCLLRELYAADLPSVRATGKETPFLRRFYIKIDHFTKTGSGQT
eukprot:COSAG06_NODE_2593_length_6607_cov_2.577904_2_plen_377_part_00